jgi:hypothetical protein
MNWDLAWGAFLGAAGLTFGVLETLGIQARNNGKPTGTLSAALRRWLGLDPVHWRRFLLGPLFAGGLGLLVVHILTAWI